MNFGALFKILCLKKFFSLFFLDEKFLIFLDDEVIKGTLKKKDSKKKQDDVKKHELFQLYMNLFNIGIEGLLETMPSDFHHYLATQLKPIFNLMQSISMYSNSITGSKEFPYIKYPQILQSTENQSGFP